MSMTTEELKKATEYLKKDIHELMYRFQETTGFWPEVEIINKTERTIGHCQTITSFEIVVKVLLD
jgi:ribosomal protein L29